MTKPLPPFVEYLTREILPQIWDFSLRTMMGAYILRSDSVTFSILDEWKWYLRTIFETEDWYVQHGCEKFHYIDKKGNVVYMPYHKLPEWSYEDIPLLIRLIQEAIIAAKSAKK